MNYARPIKTSMKESEIFGQMRFHGGMVKTSALYTKGRWFEPHRRRFFTPTVVLLSFKKPETVLWTIAIILLYYLAGRGKNQVYNSYCSA